MDVALDGYRFERRLRESAASEVWAAVREADERPVIAKVFAIEGRPGLEARVRHEFELIRRLEVDGVVRALAYETGPRTVFLILDAYPGVDLATYAGGQALALDRFFPIAIRLTEILAEVHARRVIHRDIKPTNVLVDAAGQDVVLADFGISVLLESERGHINDPAIMRGTLPYISPEQTGRTGREVDVRSDLYSLGVTFYELLTGRRPFRADSSLELIHAHLARRPEPPCRVRPELPEILGALVLKLLEKAPERRYQSARGLLEDLIQIEASRGAAGIELGKADVPLNLQLPHQLYAREHARGALQVGLRAALRGPPVFGVVVGDPGLGKTAMLGELARPVMGLHGRLIWGRYERGRDEPLSGLRQALEQLADQLLTETPDQLERWQQQLRAQLGPLGPVVTELAPRFGALIGTSAPRLSALDSAGARNRIRQACVRVLEVVASPDAPLVLALDDLDWADATSLELVDHLTASAARGLMVVASVRPEALESGTPLAQLWARYAAAAPERFIRVDLDPLDPEALTQMLADTFSLPLARVAELAEITGRKTDGNPFFVRQYLQYLDERGLLRRERGGWTWTTAELASAALPEDALGLMTRKLQRLDGRALDLVQTAAVLGGELDPGLLEQVTGLDDVAARLLHLVDEGLLSPSASGGFVFAHGRIRDHAYAMIEPDRRRAQHLAVGQALLASLGAEAEALGGDRFDIVEHLDRGHGLWPRPDPSGPGPSIPLEPGLIVELVRLNLRAGQRALATGAPATARAYLEIANGLVEGEGARQLPDIRDEQLQLQLGLAAAEGLTHASEAAEARLQRVATQMVLTPLERAEVAELRCRVAIYHTRFDEAADHALGGLAALGVELSRDATQADVVRLLPRLLWTVRAAALERLAELAPLDNPRIAAAHGLLTALAPIAFMVSPPLYVCIAAVRVELSMAHGFHPSTPVALTQVGLVLANAFGRRRQAREIADLCAQFVGEGPEAYRLGLARVYLQTWVDPLLDLIESSDQVASAALAVGDLNAAGQAKFTAVEFALFGGEHLASVAERAAGWSRWTAQWGVLAHIGAGKRLEKFCARLVAGPALGPGEVDPLGLLSATTTGEGLPEAVELDGIVHSALLAGVYGRWPEVYSLLDPNLDRIERVLRGSWYVGPARMLWALACAELAHGRQGAARRAMLRKVGAGAAKLAQWRADGNVEHLEALVEAELSALAGDLERASRMAERARELALAQRNPIYASFASERLAQTLIRAGHPRLALGPLLDARQHYFEWGAAAKVADLEASSKALALVVGRSSSTTRTPDAGPHSTSTSGATSAALDTASLFKAAQTLAEDLRLHEVLDRVMAIALENTGAEWGVLVLAAKGELSVAAEADVDQTRSYLDEPPALESFGSRLPRSLLLYVHRTGEAVALRDARADPRFAGDPYFAHEDGPGELSVLCMPMIKRRRTVGLFYFENRLGAAAFGPERLELLELLSGHAASALENARLYEHLRDSEIRWRSLVDQLPDYVMLIARNGRTEYVNALARPRQFGGGGSFNAPAFVAGLDADRVNAAVAGVLDSGAREELEVQIELSGSDLRWFAVRVAPIVIEGEIDRVIVVATDIEDRKRAESERDQFEGQLRQQQRLDSIGTLASGVAHEINNPIQGIMNYAELITSAAKGNELVEEFAGEIDHEAQRVATIVRQLLAFSREELSEAAEPATVSEVVEGTVALTRAIMRRDQISLVIEVPDDLPKVACRRQQIQQVIMNLVTNARDALNVRYEGYHEDKGIRVSADAFEVDGVPWIRIYVCDRGGGIPTAVVGRIFDPFFTTKGRDHGTGLGLAVSHGIVAEHGGNLVLDNEPGVGACFAIELPCTASFRPQ